MKHAALTLAALLLTPFAALHAAEPVRLPSQEQFHLYLLVGQSNMAGRGTIDAQDQTPQPRVLMLTRDGQWAPAVDPLHFDKPAAGVGLGRTFGIEIARDNPNITIGLIPCAVGGSPIDAWKPGAFYEPTNSHPWDDCIRRAKLALESGQLRGILWHQGEADSLPELAPAYEAKLHDLAQRLRAELGAPHVPFIAGQLGQFTDAPWDDAKRQVDQAHRTLPQRVAHSAFVSSDGLQHKGDKVHFDAASYRELGRRYAAAYRQLAQDQPQARADFQAGVALVDVTPPQLPVLVNGGMLSRTVDKINTRVHARALVLGDGTEQVAIVVVDSCMMGRAFLDEAKALAESRTGISSQHMLISATHAHSAPASMGCLGTDADPAYVPYLRDRIAEAIAQAQAALRPARIGFARGNAAEFTALRQWIRRPDRLAEDPFGNLTVRANMHAGRNWDDAVGEAGPEDPDLSLISIQTRDGRPLAVLGNFSMHYFGDRDISADYFGLFCEGLKQRLAPEADAEQNPFLGLMSHGCSGDIWRRDYTRPASEWNDKLTIDEYTRGLLDIAVSALANIAYRADADLSMAERRLTLNYRVPDKQRLEWAQRVVADMGDRLAKNQTEVYAREQIILHERQRTEIVVQALRIGDIGIATTPCETYAITGLKIKAASPLAHNMVIELANGGDGYIPPPEQHPFGGYNTWPARSAGLEVMAEPKITQSAIELLEQVSGHARRPWKLSDGPAARGVLELRPVAYWRLNEFTGPHARDASPHARDAVYEPAITYYLAGPISAEFCATEEANRAPHFVGGRLRARLPAISERYSIALWLWNGMPTDARDVNGWLFSRGRDQGLAAQGDHLGVGGKSAPGRLIFFQGNDPARIVAGKTEIPRWQWRQVILTRDGETTRVYLNGQLEIETTAPASFPADLDEFFFGGRSDNESNWEGRLDEVAVFDRPLTAEEVTRLAPRQP